MICELCKRDRPLTYRSPELKIRHACADCIREHFPETVPQLEAVMPTRAIPRTHTFTVAGRGLFPFDMLRYDRCVPKQQSDSAAIERSTHSRGSVTHHIRLQGPKAPTEGRWASFGWLVESVE